MHNGNCSVLAVDHISQSFVKEDFSSSLFKIISFICLSGVVFLSLVLHGACVKKNFFFKLHILVNIVE